MGKRVKASNVWDRDPHDWYVEPARCTEQLLDVETFDGWTHDPTCGQGNIVTTLLARGVPATGSDLVQRVIAPWHMGTACFLYGDGGLFGARNVVFNPPFYRATGAERCIKRALAEADGKVAAFVEKRFLMSEGRAHGLFYADPPSRIWFIAKRPSCPPGGFLAAGGEAKGGTPDYVWLVWDDKPRRLMPGNLAQAGWLR